MPAKAKLKMHDAGTVHSVPAEPTATKKEVYYQTINIDHEDVPKLADKKVGEECLILHRAKIVSQSLHRYGDKKGKPYTEVELRQVAGVPAAYDNTKKPDKMINGVLAALEGYTN